VGFIKMREAVIYYSLTQVATWGGRASLTAFPGRAWERGDLGFEGGETGFLIKGFGWEAKVVAETRFLGFWGAEWGLRNRVSD
jgi:hypothetical protein